MPVTAAVLRELLRTGMTAEDMVEATERIERDEGATKPLSAGAERTRRWRESVTKRHGDVTVTSQASQSVTKRHKASQNVTKRHGDVTGDAASHAEPQDSTTYSSLQQKEDPQKENPKWGKRKRVSDGGTRIPADWSEDGETAKAEGLSQQESTYEADRFRDYWRGIPGRHGRKIDWLATWRNWCRKAAEQRSRGPRGQPDRPGGFAAVRAEILSGGDLDDDGKDDDGKDDDSGGESGGQGPDSSSDVLDLVAESIVHPQRD